MTPERITFIRNTTNAWLEIYNNENGFKHNCASVQAVPVLAQQLMDVLDVLEAQQTALANEREQCCKDTCLYCAKDYPLFLANNAMDANAPKQWAHKVPGSTFAKYCHAYAIRQRAAQEKPAVADQGSESEVK